MVLRPEALGLVLLVPQSSVLVVLGLLLLGCRSALALLALGLVFHSTAHGPRSPLVRMLLTTLYRNAPWGVGAGVIRSRLWVFC